jgi:hypothetical protein
MPKSDTKRVNETLDMIQGAHGFLSPAIRASICELVGQQFPRLTQNDRDAYSQLSSDMSVKMKIPVREQRGDAHARELLWKTIGKAQEMALEQSVIARAQRAMTMDVARLQEAFSDVMLKAAVVASPLGAQFVFDNRLLEDPLYFIKYHRIDIFGSAAGSERFSDGNNGNNFQNTLDFYFHYDSANDKFVFAEFPMQQLHASHDFKTVSVPAVHWKQVPNVGDGPDYNFGEVLGCELAGADFMLTTQLTGCAFSWTNHGGLLRASHLSPKGGGDEDYPGLGLALATKLKSSGRMANAGNTPLVVFGMGDGNAPVPTGNQFYPNIKRVSRVSVFGVRQQGGGWRFYTQAINRDTGQIFEARCIMS